MGVSMHDLLFVLKSNSLLCYHFELGRAVQRFTHTNDVQCLVRDCLEITHRTLNHKQILLELRLYNV